MTPTPEPDPGRSPSPGAEPPRPGRETGAPPGGAEEPRPGGAPTPPEDLDAHGQVPPRYQDVPEDRVGG